MKILAGSLDTEFCKSNWNDKSNPKISSSFGFFSNPSTPSLEKESQPFVCFVLFFSLNEKT